MKNLLIVIAILMLGCGTDTEIVKEPPPAAEEPTPCLLYTSPSPRDGLLSRMPSSA